MNSYLKRFYILLIFLTCLGCAALPVKGTLPDGASIQVIVHGVKGEFALSEDAKKIAYIRNSIEVSEIHSNNPQAFALEQVKEPYLAWNSDGSLLASADNINESVKTDIFDNHLKKIASVTINGSCSGIYFNHENELIIAITRTKVYRFGASSEQLMVKWDLKSNPSEIHTGSVTLRPAVYNSISDKLVKMYVIKPHPLNDTILFTTLHDPPQFSTYRKLWIKHLGNGSIAEVAAIPLSSDSPEFTGEDDKIITAINSNITGIIDPWGETDSAQYQLSGNSISISPGARLMLIDGRLIDSGKVIAQFPESVKALFSKDGSALFLKYNDTIFSLSPLKRKISDKSDENNSNIMKLRALRAEKLISPSEFDSALKGIK